jgi:hypothetical protein
MLFDDITASVIRGMAKDKLLSEDDMRKGRMNDRWQLLAGDYKSLVKAELGRIFANPASAKKVTTLFDVSSNAFKQIIEEIYNYQGAERKFLTGDLTDDDLATVDPVWTQVEKDCHLARIMVDAFLYVGAFNDCLIQVLPGTEQGDEVKLRVFRPDEVTVIPFKDEPRMPAVVMYQRESSLGIFETVVWTPDEHYIVDSKGNMRPVDGAVDTVNPFGFVPFVPVHKSERDDSFWDDISEQSLVEFTLQYCAGWSALNYQRHMQNFSQPIITNAGPDDPMPQDIDPGKLWVFRAKADGSPSADMKAVLLQSDIRQSLEALQEQLTMKVSEYGISRESFLRTGAPSSGFSKMMERQSLLERREHALSYFLEAEMLVCNMVRYMWNLMNPSQKINESAIIYIEFEDEPMKLSALEKVEVEMKKLELIEKKIALGLMTPEEAKMKYDQESKDKN